MDCGPISALQDESPAKLAGLKIGDKLLSVNGLKVGTDLDPLKLPNEFAHWAGEEIEVRVKRQKDGGGTEEFTAKVVPADRPGWVERPEIEGDPLSVPAIGIALHIIPKVIGVERGQPRRGSRHQARGPRQKDDAGTARK